MALQNGNSGTSVADLQKKLNDAGYTPALSTDGKFGSKTEAAVRWYQEKNGLEVDGVAGTTTMAAFDGTSDTDSDGDHLSTAKFNGIPGQPDLWKTTEGTVYLVYFADGVEPPLPMLWEVKNETELEAFFGPGKTITYDKTLSQAQVDSTGAMIWGTSTEIVDTEEDPLEGWSSRWERERTVRPYLEDPEVYALYASAALEGRSVTTAELESTVWFQDHSEPERAWIITNASDPLTAQQMIVDNRTAAYEKLRTAGVADPPENLVNFIADQLTTGQWTNEHFNQQIVAISDPASNIDVDAGVTNVLAGGSIDTTQEMEDRVRTLVTRWLGTNFGQWDDATVASWAGRIRNEGDAEAVLLETLKDQREALFPGYDREADYDTIASPWRNMIRNSWGEVPDDSDKLLQNIIRMNDAGEAGKVLTKEGLARGNDMTVNTVQTALSQTFGGS